MCAYAREGRKGLVKTTPLHRSWNFITQPQVAVVKCQCIILHMQEEQSEGSTACAMERQG